MAVLVQLTCPSCQQGTLSTIHDGFALQSCAHCGFTAQAMSFGMTPAAALPPAVARRDTHRLRPAASSTLGGAAPPKVTVPAEPPISEPPADRWVPMRPAGPKLNNLHAGLILQHESPDNDLIEPAAPKHRYRLPIALVAAVLAALLVAMNVRQTNDSEEAKKLAASQVRPTPPKPKPTAEQVRPAVAVSSASGAEPELLLGPDEQEREAKRLLEAMINGAPAERPNLVADGTDLEDTIARFFRQQTSPLVIEGVRMLPVGVKVLPGSKVSSLCEIKSSASAEQTSITRLVPQEDGSVKLDWHLLHDSLTGQLSDYAKKPETQPRWISVGVRRTFGFDEEKTVRDQFHVLDVQGSGNGADRTVVLLNRETPTGRLLDQSIAWNELYLVRLLLHWETVGEKKRLCIIDAEMRGHVLAAH